MATAQELLEQVDALMRRNRALETEAAPGGAPPVPPQAAPDSVPGSDHPPEPGLSETLAGLAPSPQGAPDALPDEATHDLADEVPVLTEVVAAFGPAGALDARSAGDEDARWRELADGVRSLVLREFGLTDEAGSRGELDRRLGAFADRVADELAVTLRGQIENLLRDCVAITAIEIVRFIASSPAFRFLFG